MLFEVHKYFFITYKNLKFGIFFSSSSIFSGKTKSSFFPELKSIKCNFSAPVTFLPIFKRFSRFLYSSESLVLLVNIVRLCPSSLIHIRLLFFKTSKLILFSFELKVFAMAFIVFSS